MKLNTGLTKKDLDKIIKNLTNVSSIKLNINI